MTNADSEDEDLHETGPQGSNQFSTSLADEFIQSESSYRAAIDLLCKSYMQPLMNASPKHLKPDLENFFGDLFNIVACHDMLKRRIEQCGQDDVSNFPLLLVEFVPSFHQFYNNYILRYAVYTELKDKLYKELGQDWFVNGPDSLSEDLKKNHSSLSDLDVSLESLMIMPMQRLVRYSLLTDEWMKALEKEDKKLQTEDADAKTATTGTTSSASEGVQARPRGLSKITDKAKEAQRAIYKLCASANVSKEIMVSSKRIMDLEKSIGLEGLFKGERKLLNEGIFQRATRTIGTKHDNKDKNWKFRTCRCLLFDQNFYLIKLRDEDNGFRSYQRIPLGKIKSVRNIKADPAHPLHALTGFILRYSVGSTTESRIQPPALQGEELGSSEKRQSGLQQRLVSEDDGVEKDMCLLDEDELSVSAWVHDVNFAIDAWYHGNESSSALTFWTPAETGH